MSKIQPAKDAAVVDSPNSRKAVGVDKRHDSGVFRWSNFNGHLPEPEITERKNGSFSAKQPSPNAVAVAFAERALGLGCVYDLETEAFWGLDGRIWREWRERDVRDSLALAMHAAEHSFGDGRVGDVVRLVPGFMKSKVESLPDRFVALDDCLLDCFDLSRVEWDGRPDPSLMATVHVPVSFADLSREPECPEWLATLGEVLVGKDGAHDPSMAAVLQEFFGYCLLPQMDSNSALFLLGEGSNGKKNVIETLEAMFQPHLRSNVSLAELSSSRFKKSDLVGRRVNVVSEEESEVASSGLFKAITSGDSMSAERKFGPTFSFRPRCKWVCSMNEPPRFRNADFSLFRRFVVMPMNRRFGADAKPNRLLEESRAREIGEIRLWALKGAMRLVGNGMKFSRSDAVDEAVGRMSRLLSSTAAFVADRTAPCGYPNASLTDLMAAYKDWCRDNAFMPMNSNGLAKAVKEAYGEAVSARAPGGGKEVAKRYRCGVLGQDRGADALPIDFGPYNDRQ